MEDNRDDLAALIASRICHDLISPIGAILNGLELLDLSSAKPRAELGLIADSAAHASARIRFFRIAYGAPGDQLLAPAEITAVLDQASVTGRVQTVWHPQQPHPRSQVRLAFLALQCCETAMPHGGQAEVTEQDGSWTVSGRSETMNLEPALWSGLRGGGPGADVPPGQIQFALLPAVAAGLGRSVAADSDGAGITIRF